MTFPAPSIVLSEKIKSWYSHMLGISLRIHDSALNDLTPRELIDAHLEPFCKMYGVMVQLTVGHHTNAKRPHWHFHAIVQPRLQSPSLPQQAYNAPLAWWRYGRKGMPPPPPGVKDEISVKVHDELIDRDRFLSYPLKEVAPAEHEEAESNIFPLCYCITPSEFSTLAHRANAEYQVALQSQRRNAEAEAKRNTILGKLYKVFDDLIDAGDDNHRWTPLMEALFTFYLSEVDDLPAPHIAQKTLLVYFGKRGLITPTEYARLTIPRGFPPEST